MGVVMSQQALEPEVVQTNEGTPHEVKSRYGDSRTVKIDREWSVRLDGVEVGRPTACIESIMWDARRG